jgi:hypothetical protein
VNRDHISLLLRSRKPVDAYGAKTILIMECNCQVAEADLRARAKRAKEQWSPEQIADRLPREGIVSISHETIYRHVVPIMIFGSSSLSGRLAISLAGTWMIMFRSFPNHRIVPSYKSNVASPAANSPPSSIPVLVSPASFTIDCVVTMYILHPVSTSARASYSSPTRVRRTIGRLKKKSIRPNNSSVESLDTTHKSYTATPSGCITIFSLVGFDSFKVRNTNHVFSFLDIKDHVLSSMLCFKMSCMFFVQTAANVRNTVKLTLTTIALHCTPSLAGKGTAFDPPTSTASLPTSTASLPTSTASLPTSTASLMPEWTLPFSHFRQGLERIET